MPWAMLSLLLPLGAVAGLLSGLLGIGGGLIFSPLLLLMGLGAHQALATSTLAIVPTTLAGTWAHLRQGLIPGKAALAIAMGAGLGGALFSKLSFALSGWQLLGLQAAMYGLLCLMIRPKVALASKQSAKLPLAGLVAVGSVAGLAGGMLGVGGGLVMVPLMVQLLAVPVHLAIRLSTLAVLAASSIAAVGFVESGRALVWVGLTLGSTAAIAAQWSAARLDRVPEQRLVWLLRLLTLLLALDSGRRAVQLVLSGAGQQ